MNDMPVVSVSEYLDILNETLKLAQNSVYVEGEISGLQKHPTGIYFSLKDIDDGSILNCYASPRLRKDSTELLAEGAVIRIQGLPNIYKPKGRMSLMISEVLAAGESILRKQYEQLKSRLEAEGLFTRKRPLPEKIQRIGLVTSKTGAVIHDFQNNLKKHGYQITLCHTQVEGARAVEGIQRALRTMQKVIPEPDVIVVIRGGGSLEDLQAFNSEAVARTIYNCRVPVVCAIGHDRDIPISQLVADAAFSTPTAAAVAINDTWADLERTVERATLVIRTTLQEIQYIPQRYTNRIRQCIESQYHHVEIMRMQTKSIQASLISRTQTHYQNLRHIIDTYELELQARDPKRILRMGYALVRQHNGAFIRPEKAPLSGEILEIQTINHTISAIVDKVKETT